MRIDVLTLFPEMFEGFKQTSMVSRAIERKALRLSFHDFRKHSQNKHHQVDDYAYGGFAGMVLQAEPVPRYRNWSPNPLPPWCILLPKAGCWISQFCNITANCPE